jgi:hypothetical protein
MMMTGRFDVKHPDELGSNLPWGVVGPSNRQVKETKGKLATIANWVGSSSRTRFELWRPARQRQDWIP